MISGWAQHITGCNGCYLIAVIGVFVSVLALVGILIQMKKNSDKRAVEFVVFSRWRLFFGCLILTIISLFDPQYVSEIVLYGRGGKEDGD